MDLIRRWRDWRNKNREQDDWRHRRGRFAGLDPDRPGRAQVMPVREPAEEPSHRWLDAARERRAGDGS
jgi:hypothetical protein